MANGTLFGEGVAVTFLLLEEYFSTGDDQFVEALRQFHVPGSLTTIADKWKKDPRPWAKQQILRYLDEPLVASGHETVVKRLFKQAEENKDDELMAAFAAAFDRLVRRERKTRWRWDSVARQGMQVEVLHSPPNAIPTPSPSAKRGRVVPDFNAQPMWPSRVLFSYHTRYYLRRRAWRYFRRMGFQRPDDYPTAVSRMLKRYRDPDLTQGENILDSWSLLHACFGESDVLEFGESHAKIRQGRAMRELSPAPSFGELWKQPQSSRVLLDLLLESNSRLVRVWSLGLLKQHHAEALSNMPVGDIRRLLDHPDEQIQLLGEQLLENSTQLDKLPVSAWLELVSLRNPTLLETVCQLMARHVRAERLDLQQCVDLASAKPYPVARLGLEFLKGRNIVSEDDREEVAQLADARCARTGAELAEWALARLGSQDVYRVDRVSRFFDSLLREMRDGAWTWLKPQSAGWNDPQLWGRLIETPYDDVRLHFVSALEERVKLPAIDASNLSTIWASVLLGIHRGGRHKLIALRQISDAVRGQPQSAEILLPVLAVAIRSVRPPEARAGLSAVVSAVEARSELVNLIQRLLPELQLSPAEVAR